MQIGFGVTPDDNDLDCTPAVLVLLEFRLLLLIPGFLQRSEISLLSSVQNTAQRPSKHALARITNSYYAN